MPKRISKRACLFFVSQLWALEALSVFGGVFAAFFMQYAWHMSACVLCWVDRWIWMAYGFLLLKGWQREASHGNAGSWLSAMRWVRYGLIAISIFHLELIKGHHDFCISSELLALRGGLWSWLAAFDLRSCADEPALLGFLPIPVCLLLVYLYWELLHLVRRTKCYKRS